MEKQEKEESQEVRSAQALKPPTSSDYITITTGHDYIEHPTQVEYITTLLESIASLEIEGDTGLSDLHYLKNILSSTLYKRRELYIFTGTGANGKSLISDVLINPTLSEYYKTMPANYYTKSDHSANCALANKQYCRGGFPLNLRRRKNYRYRKYSRDWKTYLRVSSIKRASSTSLPLPHSFCVMTFLNFQKYTKP